MLLFPIYVQYVDGSSEPSSDEEFFGHVSVAKPLELNSPDSITEAILPLVNLQSPERVDVKRHPSPYYYADLYKQRTEDSSAPPSRGPKSTISLESEPPTSSSHGHLHQQFKYRKSCSLDEQDREGDSTPQPRLNTILPSRYFIVLPRFSDVLISYFFFWLLKVSKKF